MFAVPSETPETTPVVALTEAMVKLLVVQVPPALALVKVVELPRQTALAPTIVSTVPELTVSITVRIDVPHEFVTLYTIVEVPALTAVTTPAEFTIATAVLIENQVPPVVVLDNVTVEPTQCIVGPVIGATTGGALTVTA
jgi:hypothetical protein